MAVESKSVKQSWLPYQLILDRFAISTNIMESKMIAGVTDSIVGVFEATPID